MSEETKNTQVPEEEAISEKELNEQMQVRINKMHQIEEHGWKPFGHKFEVTNYSADINQNFEELAANETVVRVAGRIMAIRGHGKTCFMDMQDKDGRIQLYVRKDAIGEEKYALIKLLDIGDIIGVSGTVFRTHMGELSVKAVDVEILSKSLRPLPEKWHGLKDVDTRYRQRYVDLIVNPKVRRTFVLRSKIIKSLREILDDNGYLEVETPIMNTIPGGAAARPFITYHNALDMQLYLRIATELHLKRLVVGGFDRVYELGRVFRNEGIDIKHNPEFTSVEIYQAYGDYTDMMDLTEKIISEIAQKVLGTMKITYEGQEIDLTPPWPRLSMIEAVAKYTGQNFEGVTDVETARKMADAIHVEYEPTFGVGKIINACFDEYVEDKLIQPVFITGHPKEISPLAKSNPDNPEITDRFEGYIYGREMCNGFTELNDPIDQRERFLKQVEERNAGDEEANMMDEDFLNALEHGLPPTGGLGIGVDRLVMLLTDSSSIRDVLLFPTMKNIGGEKTANKVDSADEAANGEALPKIDLSKVKVDPLFEDFVDFDTFCKSDFRVVKVEACEAVPKSKKLLRFTLNDGSDKKRTILSGIREFYEPEELVGKTCVAITNLPPRKMMGIDSEGMLISAVYEYDGKEGLNLLMLDDNIPAGAKLR
jgi:lysyl-tRNA synthetase class 2